MQIENIAWPVVDTRFVADLRDELRYGRGYRGALVARFSKLLPQCLDRMRFALTTGDMTGARETLTALALSASTVGATRLARYAVAVEGELRTVGCRDQPALALPRLAVQVMPLLERCGEQTSRELEAGETLFKP